MPKFTEPRYDEVYEQGVEWLDEIARTGSDLKDQDTQDYDYPGPDPDTLTCKDCSERSTCKFVDDWYNTDGDCLAYK
jgi:hypothetical protein